MSIKVTTVIPCLNASDTLERCVSSVRSQATRSDLVIVDDNSDASEADRICRIGAEYRARIIRLPEHGGPAAARNAGLDATNTQFVCFLDADDVWLPGKLCAQVAEMERRQLEFSYTRYANVRAGRARIMPAPASLTRSELLGNTAIGCSTVMLCRKFVGERRFAEADCEDVAFWAHLLEFTQRAYRVGDGVGVHRYLGGRSHNRILSAHRYWRTLRGALGLPFHEAARYFVPYAARAVGKHWLSAAYSDDRSRAGAQPA